MLLPLSAEHEAARLQELRSLDILDTKQDSLFDDIVRLEVISLFTLVT